MSRSRSRSRDSSTSESLHLNAEVFSDFEDSVDEVPKLRGLGAVDSWKLHEARRLKWSHMFGHLDDIKKLQCQCIRLDLFEETVFHAKYAIDGLSAGWLGIYIGVTTNPIQRWTMKRVNEGPGPDAHMNRFDAMLVLAHLESHRAHRLELALTNYSAHLKQCDSKTHAAVLNNVLSPQGCVAGPFMFVYAGVKYERSATMSNSTSLRGNPPCEDCARRQAIFRMI